MFRDRVTPIVAAALAAALPLGPASCRVKPAPAPPARAATNVLLITVDTLRPDALGFVSGGNSTPAIDRIAHEGFAFASAVSAVPLTFPSHCALMTGRLPRALGLRDNGQVLAADAQTLAERLKMRGYATAAFVSGYPLASIFGLDRGFTLYDDAFTSGGSEEPERAAGATVAAARAWLATARPPWFAWVHLYDPHYPYDPPAAYRRPGPRGAYDGEVAYADSAIGQLRASIEALAPASTLTVFAGDHGESLGEHGEGTHGFFIYDSTVLVPLIFRFPGRVAPGASAAGARLIDVVPTVLALLQIAPAEGLDGASLAPFFTNPRASAQPAYVETYQPWLSYGWSPLSAIRAERWKLIDAPRPELYDVRSDPGERQNRLEQAPEEVRKLKTLLRQTRAAPAVAVRPAADPEALARLRSLGYLGGSSPEAEPPAQGLRDPKDGAAIRELLTKADELLRRGQPRGAAIAFEAALEHDPDNRFALHRSGIALLALDQVQKALSRLEKAVRLDPNQPEARWALAQACTRAGRHEAATAQWKEVTRLQPRRAEAWANLGSSLGRSGKTREAVLAISHAVELSPGKPELLARLAFAEYGAGQLEEAARHLSAEAQALPAEGFHHSAALGILLVQLGRTAEARPWLIRSRRDEAEYGEARLDLAILEAQAGREGDARRALAEALRASPALRVRARADRRLVRLLP
ncbi:MAG: sulfatase-like hydrolase/transferase [Acidobacteriota bacterium]